MEAMRHRAQLLPLIALAAAIAGDKIAICREMAFFS
jgi:hypothetical protein